MNFDGPITIYQTDLFKSFIVFYLLALSPQSTPILFRCFQEKYITHNPLVQFILTFGLFYFLVTLVYTNDTVETDRDWETK